MDSSVRPRPNYYETLGLMPGASDDEIGQAFTKKMSLSGMRPVGGAAQICAAYETLRDPAKRREHDRSLGLAPKARPKQWTVPSPKPHWEPFLASPATKVVEQQESEPIASSEPQESSPEHRAAVEPRTASFIAEALRELARPAAHPAVHEATPSPSLDPQRHWQLPKFEAEEDWSPPIRPEIGPEPDVREILANRFVPEERAYDVDERHFNWKRPAVALGGLVVAAGLVGTVAGLSLRNEEGPTQSEAAVTVALPAATEHSIAAPSEPPSILAAVGTKSQPPAAPTFSTTTRPTTQPHKAADFAEKAIRVAQAADGAAVDPKPIETASDEVDPNQPAAEAVAANLPLPSAVIARTIDRIGYPCGEVTSATTVDGTQGAFKVTCSSGSSYRAAPVHGRYHFRRW